MGMYTELVLGVELMSEPTVIDTLKRMLDDNAENKVVTIDHPLFSTSRWAYMLLCDSYYFDGQTDSKLVYDEDSKSYYLNVRCNLKNYDNEIEQFLDWLCPYIRTQGFLGYSRYEGNDDPTLIYKEDGKIEYVDAISEEEIVKTYLEKLESKLLDCCDPRIRTETNIPIKKVLDFIDNLLTEEGVKK